MGIFFRQAWYKALMPTKVSFLVRVLISSVLIFAPLASLDQWFYDQFFRVRGKLRKPTEIVMVRVSDAKILQLLERDLVQFNSDGFAFEHSTHSIWFLPFYEKILKQIELSDPKIIVFTPFFEWVIQSQSHLLEADNIIFSSLINDENKITLPPRKITNRDNYGFNNIFPDRDNIVRQTSLVYSYGESLALAAHQVLYGSKYSIARDLMKPLRIDFRGPAGSFPSVEASDLFQGNIPTSFFSNKIVLIGRESSFSTSLETPFGKMSPVEIQANILNTFISQTEIRVLERRTSLMISAFCIFLAIFIILYFPLTFAWILLVLFGIAYSLLTLLIFSELKVWMGVANPLFCIYGAHLLMLGYKLSREEEKHWKLRKAAEYSHEMDQFKNNFISLFSHDLKTPIATIKAITDRVLTQHKDSLKTDVVDAFKTIDKTNAELSRFITDILKVTKMESNSLEPRKEVIDLNRLVEAAVHRLKFQSEEKKIRLVMDLEPLFSIEGDEQLIQEVIMNLLENAIKYSEPNKEVVVRTREIDNQVVTTVIDQGSGIPADELPRVTAKFYRGKLSREASKGSGLGLYLSKYFVELHGGTLNIISQIKKGTEVSFSLPLPKG